MSRNLWLISILRSVRSFLLISFFFSPPPAVFRGAVCVIANFSVVKNIPTSACRKGGHVASYHGSCLSCNVAILRPWRGHDYMQCQCRPWLRAMQVLNVLLALKLSATCVSCVSPFFMRRRAGPSSFGLLYMLKSCWKQKSIRRLTFFWLQM